MSLGLVLALKAEARAMLGRGRWQGKGASSLGRVKGPNGTELIISLCGPGRKRAAAGAGLLLEKKVDVLFNAGISGGLSPELKAGDLVLASEVIDEHGHLYGIDKGAIEFAAAAFKSSGTSFRQGAVLSTESALLEGASKRKFYEKTGAVAVDMESGAVAATAAVKSIPLFIMRAICDEAGEVISPDLYACLGEDGGVRPGQVLGGCLRRPAMVGEMMRLRRSYNLALSTLGQGWKALEEAGFFSFLSSPTFFSKKESRQRKPVGE